MYCIILTGTIASGKSTVADFFAGYGITVIDADKIAKTITLPGSDCHQRIIQHFGSKVTDNNQQTLNRRKLRNIIFSNSAERIWLENLLHPIIRENIQEELARSTSPYSIVEIPLLFNREQYSYANRILLTLSPQNIQMQRLLKRDGTDTKQAEAILKAQPDEKTRIHLADDILLNDGSLDDLGKKVQDLHHKYLFLSHR